MSKRNQIQEALLAINPAAFQILGDAYFSKQRLGRLTSVGSVVGKERTKTGTPDTLIATPNGKYIFIEYTVQVDACFAKMSDDLKKCLDEGKTGISLQKVEKIVFCATCQLSPEEQDKLQEQGATEGCVVETVGIDALTWDLLQKYPDLAKEHLGVEVDTGQVLDAEAFVSQYQRSGWAAPLSTQFRGREEELVTALQQLEHRDVMVVTGKAGMGKSRFALECARLFGEAHPEYEFRCILNNGLSIYEDLKAHFPGPGNFLILVDDANRIQELRQVINLLGDNQPGAARHIKVILTVRDYVAADVVRALPEHLRYSPIVIGLLSNEKINEIVSSDFGISHPIYHDHIKVIAQGNPRIAVMAARLVTEKGNLASISDASALYDEYFSSVVKDISDLGNRHLLQSAGVVAFLRVVARVNDELFSKVAEGLRIEPDRFWEDVASLDSSEIVDLHENEVAKMSDQILASYLVYRVFFKEKVCDLGTVLDALMEHSPERLSDAIHPIVNAFDSTTVYGRLGDYVRQRWARAESQGDEETLLNLARTFYFVNEAETLLLVQNRIDSLPEVQDSDEADFLGGNQPAGEEEPYLGLLERVRHWNPAYAPAVVQLLFDYLEKKPALYPRVVTLLNEGFCFQKNSYFRSYDVELNIIQELKERLNGPYSALYEDVILDIAAKWLGCEFDSTWLEGRLTVTVTRFHLHLTPELHELRSLIWAMLFRLYRKVSRRRKVLEILHSYSGMGRRKGGKQILRDDARSVVPFLQNLNEIELDECIAAHAYFACLKYNKVKYPSGLPQTFSTEDYCLLEVLQTPRNQFIGSNWDEIERQKTRERQRYFATFQFAGYTRLLSQIERIAGGIDVNREGLLWELHWVFMDVAARNSNLFRRAVTYLLKSGNGLELQSEDLILAWIRTYKRPSDALALLAKTNFRKKFVWLFTWHKSPRLAPSHRDFLKLVQLYEEAPSAELPRDFRAVTRYLPVVPDAIQAVVRLLLARTKEEDFAFDFQWLFPDYGETNSFVEELLTNDFDLLKAAYLHHLSNGKYRDSRGKSFSLLLSRDPEFIVEYIEWMFGGHKYLSRRYDPRNYAFVWLLDNYEVIVEKAILTVRNCGRKHPSLGDSYLGAFFIRHEGEWPEGIDERIHKFLCKLVAQHSGDKGLMELIFQISNLHSEDKRADLLEVFLRHNRSYEDFARLPLEASSWSWSGSAIPMYERRINFLESILPLLVGLPFLKHRRRVEGLIHSHRDSIERELRRDFVESAL